MTRRSNPRQFLGWTLIAVCILCLGVGLYSGVIYSEKEDAMAKRVPGASSQRSKTRIAARAPQAQICTNTCSKVGNATLHCNHALSPMWRCVVGLTVTIPLWQANNGVCDDGRSKQPNRPSWGIAPLTNISCDLGSDCADCGPWSPTARPAWWEGGTCMMGICDALEQLLPS